MTLRAQKPDEVIRLAAAAGLASIEWGSDVHVPPGDMGAAERIGRQTREAGLEVSSYGSYIGFPWATGTPESIAPVLDTALALGAPRVRAWAGPTASDAVDEETRENVTRQLQNMAIAASDAGIELAIEFHLGTLADTATSTLRLLDDLDRVVSTYWQPRVGAPDTAALEDLNQLGEMVSTIHVFSWDATFGRHPLTTREPFWRQALADVAALPRVTDALLEFLPDDDAELLGQEAATLRSWLQAAQEAEAVA